MDIEKNLKELKNAFEIAEQNNISPILALELMDRANVVKDNEEYQQMIDKQYELLLSKAYHGDPNFMARSLLGYLCDHLLRGKIAKMPKPPAQMGRPPTAWGPDGEAKLSIYAGVQHQFTLMEKEGLKKSVTEAMWRFTELDKSKRGNKKKIEALCTVFSEAKRMVAEDKARKAMATHKIAK